MQKKIFVVAALICSSHLFGQVPDTSGKILGEIVVTTNKHPKKQSATGKVISVISRQQLEQSAGKNVGEVLQTVAGVTIVGANNNYGTNLTANIRGASAGNVLILVDGMPLNDPSVNNNYFDLNFFSVDRIERIEILKGGQSTLYGSDAVAGVINIITRKPAKRSSVDAGVSAGSYKTFRENFGVSGERAKIQYTLHYSHISSGGFSAAYDSTASRNFDKDGFDEHVAGGSMELRLNKKLSLKFFSDYSYYKTDLDAFAFTDDADYSVKNNNVRGGTGSVYNLDKGSVHFNYLFNYVSRDYFDDSVSRPNPYAIYSRSTYTGRTHFAEVYSNWKWDGLELLAGGDFRYNNTWQQYFSTGSFGAFSTPPLDSSVSQLSGYSSLVVQKNNFTAEAGGRWNHHSRFGDNFTYTLNPSYLVNGKAKVFLNLYSAFKAPTLYQLFDPSFGNADLQPEKGFIAEAGIDFFSGERWEAKAVGFYRRSRNVIDLIIVDPVTFESRYRNISEEKNYGTELELKCRFKKFTIAANYTFTDGKTVSPYDATDFSLGKDTSYYNLYRIPRNNVNLMFGYQPTKNIFMSVASRVVGKRFEAVYGSAPAELDSYYTVDGYLEYKRSNWKLFLDLKNITNQKYFDVLGYNSKRFNVTAGISFSVD